MTHFAAPTPPRLQALCVAMRMSTRDEGNLIVNMKNCDTSHKDETLFNDASATGEYELNLQVPNLRARFARGRRMIISSSRKIVLDRLVPTCRGCVVCYCQTVYMPLKYPSHAHSSLEEDPPCRAVL